MEPLVSVIIPVYNHENYIVDCIDSILNQSYRNLEVLLCDDCSTDRSFEIACSYEEQLKKIFPRVQMERNFANKGVCKTSNRLLKQCSGKYVFSLASDDALMQDGLWKLVEYYENHSECCFIYSNGILIDEQARFPYIINEERMIYDSEPKSGTGLFDDIFVDNFIFAPGSLVLRETYEKYGYYDETLVFDDWEYWLRITRDGIVGYCNEPTVFYRETENSLSRFFDISEYGRKKAYHYVDSMLKMVNSYKNCVSSSYKRNCGLRKAVDFCVNRAIAIKDKELIKEVLNFGRENHIRMSLRYLIKYMFYRLHLLDIFVQITRRG